MLIPHAFEYEADIGEVIEDLRAVNERLSGHGRIPVHALITPIDYSCTDAIALWLSVEFGLKQDEARARLVGKSESVNFCTELSYKLVVGTELIGAMLSYRSLSPRTAYIYAIVIRKEWRKSWCTAFLKYHSLKNMRSRHIERIRFQAYGGNLDTEKHARRIHAKLLPP